MKGRHAFALLMAMRTGKTKVLLDDYGRLELNNQVSDLLVIAPAGVYRTWEDQINEHLSTDLLSRIKVATWRSGAGQKAMAAIKDFLNPTDEGPRIFLMNVEALSTVKEARAAAEKFLVRNNMIAVDESTIIKGYRAKRTKYINANLAPKATYRRILSGLPTPRDPLDLYCQFFFLDPGILGYDNFILFRYHYAVMKRVTMGGRRPFDMVVGYRNQAELQARIAPHLFRVEFRPNIPSTYSIREVTMTEEQKRIYAELKTRATAQLAAESHVTATVVIVQLLRLHQVLCGHVPDELGVMHDVPENKTKELLELLEDYAGKAVIWVSYNADVEKLTDVLRKEYGEISVARFWGGNRDEREDEERLFKNNPKCRFMIATPGAGGRGRTWDAADLVIYYSSTNNLEHRDQSEQRVQGVDKRRQVDYIDLITPGSVESKILTALRRKIDMATLINGDNWREWVV
jgi:Mesyanzhinovviridae DNA helicase